MVRVRVYVAVGQCHVAHMGSMPTTRKLFTVYIEAANRGESPYPVPRCTFYRRVYTIVHAHLLRAPGARRAPCTYFRLARRLAADSFRKFAPRACIFSHTIPV